MGSWGSRGTPRPWSQTTALLESRVKHNVGVLEIAAHFIEAWHTATKPQAAHPPPATAGPDSANFEASPHRG
eukprot:8191193-Pyramimonas_sp.AAC.1